MAKDGPLREVVREDLQHLRENWSRETTDAELRITGTVLRRLLLDGLLQKAWLAVGFERQPQVSAPDLEQMLTAVSTEQPLLFAFAGGPEVQGVQARFFAGWPGKELELNVEKDEFQRLVVTDRRFDLRAYVESPCVHAWGSNINRRQLIQYVCNKVGGAHFDTKRNKAREQAFRLLDQLFDMVKIVQHRGVYYEFLSIGRTLSASPDIEGLLGRL